LKKKDKKVSMYGQVFTPDNVVNQMINLIQYGNNILEPSCGNGQFYNKLITKFNNVTGIELDKEVITNNNILNIDFFDYDINNKFDTIIGNPPYVKYNNILNTTREKLNKFNELFDNRTNLFLYFIYKSFLHLEDRGEIIFIVPRELFDLTSALNLNTFLHERGTFTHIYTFGDKRIFGNKFNPNVIIFRYEKGNLTHKTLFNNKLKQQINSNGYLFFVDNNVNYTLTLKEIIDVKVGGVSGNDKIFEHKTGNIDVVCSYTKKTGKTKKMIYNQINDYLIKHKQELLNRRIKQFNEDNWYKWGRDIPINDRPRIYVNVKTRQENPFFLNDSIYFDGSILGLFPKNGNVNLEELKDMLNKLNWEELGFKCDGRYIFGQRKLENLILPKEFEKFL